MMPGFLLSLREGVEAALIIGIVFGVLTRFGRQELKIVVWRGVIAAVAASLLVGMGLRWLGVSLDGAAKQVFEGLALLFAAGVLIWMILWMQRHGSNLKGGIESETRKSLDAGAKSLFLLAFLAVFREGLELSLFLLASSFVTGGAATLSGAILGLGATVALGWVLFSTTRRLNLRLFFQVTNILLIFFAAGMVAYGIHELNEAGWIPAVIDPLWDVNSFLNEQSPLGVTLKILFGYNGNPSLTEVIGYVVVFTFLLVNYLRFQRRTRQAA